jgi:hypothetical protein
MPVQGRELLKFACHRVLLVLRKVLQKKSVSEKTMVGLEVRRWMGTEGEPLEEWEASLC